ncbi:transcription termination/antitermination NusG family protein [Thomasclavelia sp.]
MFWYVAHVKSGKTSKLVASLNRQRYLEAFIPKKEQWYGGKNKKTYLIKELYPDYVFIKSKFNKNEFEAQFKKLFETIEGLVEMLDYKGVYPLTFEEQLFLEKLFNGKHVIRHSVGDSINSRFVASSGPLKGLEDKIIKIDRHKRLVILNCSLFSNQFTVAAEVVNKL